MSQPSSLELRIKQGHNLRQMQRLIMSPQMQQAIALLQMPLIELADRIDQELVQNPILENADEELRNEEGEDPNSSDEMPELSTEKELSFDEDNFEILKRLDDDLRDHFDQSSGFSSIVSTDDEKLRTYLESSISFHETLFESLMNQAGEVFNRPEQLKMAEALIGNFDGSGFMNTPMAEIALLNNFDQDELLDVLLKIQQFEPVGIGARNFQECLLIQLRSLGKQDSLAYELIETQFDELLHNRIPQIQKTLGYSSTEISNAIKDVISKLELHPAACFSTAPLQTIIPDVIITLEDEKLFIKINDDTVPALRLNRRYMRYLEDPAISAETKEFVKQKIISAKWFLRNIHQRNDTLDKIAAALIKCQYEFLANPEGKLQPLTMQCLADELHLHESTIARAVANKYLDSPRGILPLRSFFTNSYVTEEGDDISSKTVKDAILKMVQSEDRQRPLSDEGISSQLKIMGITCARRTVAKYRNLMNLGNAHQRKKYI